MKRFPVLAVLLFRCTLQGQGLVLDDFETGAFTVSGSQNFTQTLPEEHVLGGQRTVRLFGGTLGSATVANSELTFNRDDNIILTLSYGSFGDANEAEHLHFDAGASGETTLNIQVPLVRREPLTITASLYSFTLESGTPAHHTSTATFTFRSGEPLQQSIRLRDFSGTANLSDLAGFQLQLGEIDFLRGTLDMSNSSLTVVPEPFAATNLGAVALFAFFLLRRFWAGRETPDLSRCALGERSSFS
ncbi:MAG TPA: hypothetical protein VK633_05610 [Verrucomicrobiae bacterium]|nr:hypothetical protein [Verrucomicrobiae bacterium]